MAIERDPETLKLWLDMGVITPSEYNEGFVIYQEEDEEDNGRSAHDREYFHWNREYYGKTHPHKKFYNIPDVEGTKHLDIGWHEGDFPIIGATLGVDLSTKRSGHYPILKNIAFEEIAASGLDLPFANGTIDSVSSQHSMGMQFDLEEGLTEAIRVLRSGGKLAILTWVTTEEIEELRRWLRSQPVQNVRIRKRDKDEDKDNLFLYGIEFTRV